MPGNINQNSQPAQRNPWVSTANARNDRTYSNRANLEPSEASYYYQSTRSTVDTAPRAWPSNPATTQSGSASNPSTLSNLLASNRTSDAHAYYAMQRWEEETPKEQPWNSLKYSVSSNKKDEYGNGKEGGRDETLAVARGAFDQFKHDTTRVKLRNAFG